MDIGDILKSERFGALDKYLTDEMNATAGENLISMMRSVLGSEEKIRNWYFSEHMALGGKRPYDLCKEGNREKVEDELNCIEYGIFS